MDELELLQKPALHTESSDTEGFVESYKTFTTVLNRLRRQYLDLKDESQRQAKELEEANESLQALTRRNHAAMEFLNSVLRSVSTGIIVVDRDNKITHLNPAAESLFSVKATESVNASLSEIISFDIPAENIVDQSNDLKEPTSRNSLLAPQRGVERTFVGGDGAERTYLWGSSQLLDKNGESFGSVEAFQDITETRQMERKMTRLESLAAIGEMAATVAHQVRNPLVGVKGFASLIATQPSKGTKNKAHAEMILRGVGNLERVIDALLRFSRAEDLTLRATNLNRYLKKVVRQYNERLYDEHEYNRSQQDDPNRKDSNYHERLKQGSAEWGAEAENVVTISNSKDKVVVDVDQLVFREAVTNIIRNAHEAAKGPITCDLLVEEVPAGSKYAYFAIRDNGPGMTDDIKRDIFRPFYTTKASGSGLGLPLARKLIIAHGGEITVNSTLGAGTTFHIKLPLSDVERFNSTSEITDNLE